MSKKKTQLERAIDQLESDARALQAKFDAEMAGLNAAIATLNQQTAARPARRQNAPEVEAPQSQN